jgi:hypothetical protein
MSKRSSKDIASNSQSGVKKQKAEGNEVEEAFETLKNVDIKQLMTSTGPTVSNVILRKDGSREEVSLDMTPSARAAQEILGGEVTFLGQYEDLQVILIINRQQTGSEAELNTHKLQPPFHTAEVYGDILLSRSDDNGLPLDFSLEEYIEFTKKVIEPFEVEDNEDDDDDDDDDDNDDDEEDEEDEEGDEEDEDEEDMMNRLLARLREAYREQHGRDPTDDEFAELADSLLEKLGGSDEEDEFEEMSGDDDDDEEEEEQEEEEVVEVQKKPTSKKKK